MTNSHILEELEVYLDGCLPFTSRETFFREAGIFSLTIYSTPGMRYVVQLEDLKHSCLWFKHSLFDPFPPMGKSTMGEYDGIDLIDRKFTVDRLGAIKGAETFRDLATEQAGGMFNLRNFRLSDYVRADAGVGAQGAATTELAYATELRNLCVYDGTWTGVSGSDWPSLLKKALGAMIGYWNEPTNGTLNYCEDPEIDRAFFTDRELDSHRSILRMARHHNAHQGRLDEIFSEYWDTGIGSVHEQHLAPPYRESWQALLMTPISLQRVRDEVLWQGVSRTFGKESISFLVDACEAMGTRGPCYDVFNQIIVENDSGDVVVKYERARRIMEVLAGIGGTDAVRAMFYCIDLAERGGFDDPSGSVESLGDYVLKLIGAHSCQK